MIANWDVGRSQRVCAVTGKAFVEGDSFFSALKEQAESFVRLDYSNEVWPEQDKSAFFSFWRTTLHKPDDKKKNRLVIDIEAFYTFFTNLEGDDKPSRILFRYLIALILVRKRVLRLDEIEKSPDGEALILYDSRTKEECRVMVSEAGEEELAQAQDEINQIFECDTEL